MKHINYMTLVILFSSILSASTKTAIKDKVSFHNGPACSESIQRRTKATFEEVKAAGAMSNRLALMDIAVPFQDEHPAMSCNSVMLIAASTQIEEELPFVAKFEGQILEKIKCIKGVQTNESFVDVLGKHTMNCFFIVPTIMLSSKGIVKIDWNINRKDQEIADFPVPNPPAKCVSKNKSNLSFAKIIKREYCIDINM